MKNHIEIIRNIENSPKFDSFQYKIDSFGIGQFGFKLARRGSYTYYWFRVYADTGMLMFWHSYSQNTGKTSYSYKKASNILWKIGYYGRLKSN